MPATSIHRRDFIQQVGLGITAAVCGVLPAKARGGRTRQVIAVSDLHVGKTAGGLDGSDWFERCQADLRLNLPDVEMGLTLGDITHHGDRASLSEYIRVRDGGPVPKWRELAGNHEYRGGGIRHFKSLLRDTALYREEDGNVVWYFISDEDGGTPGRVSPETLEQLRSAVWADRGKIVIVASHQPPYKTVRRSEQNDFCLHPKEAVVSLLTDLPIDLWLCGHEHHSPYSAGNLSVKYGTACINVASISHAYGTRSSGSLILEFSENYRFVTLRRRDHDLQKFRDEFTWRIPVKAAVQPA